MKQSHTAKLKQFHTVERNEAPTVLPQVHHQNEQSQPDGAERSDALETFRDSINKTPTCLEPFAAHVCCICRFEEFGCPILNVSTLHYNCNYHYIALHETTLQLQLHYFLHYNTLDYTTLQYTTLQYTTIHYTNYTTPQLQPQLHYTNYTTLQLQLATTTPLHYNYSYNCNYSCTTPHYIQQLW